MGSAEIRVLLTDAEIATLREAVMAAILAPAADLAAAFPADAAAATEVRRAAALLSRIGWPGDFAASGEISASDVPDARRAMLILISGALEGAWEVVTTTLDGGEEWGGVDVALFEVEKAASVLRRLDAGRLADRGASDAPIAREAHIGRVPADAGRHYLLSAPEGHAVS